MLLTNEERKLANGRIPFVKTYPNGSEETFFCGNTIHVKAPGPNGKVWSKSLPINIVTNRQYGEHHNAIKRGGKWYFLVTTEDGLIWK